MSQEAPAEPQDAVIIKYTREREFPVSAIASIGLHLCILALILFGVLSLFGRKQRSIDLEVVELAFAPGGGANGADDGARPGPVTGRDTISAVDNQPGVPLPDLGSKPFPKIIPPPAEPIIAQTDPRSPVERSVSKLPALANLTPLLKGLPDGLAGKTGTAGRGPGKGPGTGPNEGPGDGAAGKMLTEKQKRQLRWTLLFSTSGAANYLSQLRRMDAILGVQYLDQSIQLITDLSKRPARLEPGDKVPNRIFWMDDNQESVKSMSAELGLTQMPWRLIAFFPDRIEDELARKEKLYGKAYGRETEEDIRETVFRVEDDYGTIRLSVLRQEGKKK
jgi:hypothetical protein